MTCCISLLLAHKKVNDYPPLIKEKSQVMFALWFTHAKEDINKSPLNRGYSSYTLVCLSRKKGDCLLYPF